ncbi:hypothetical protein Q0M94_02390 [Deinococcus radiomollis]|uniref:hypothetical protein n=1 Tax=Deinococcus radiomollis TaxID=468916 RepID=UPI00389269E2
MLLILVALIDTMFEWHLWTHEGGAIMGILVLSRLLLLAYGVTLLRPERGLKRKSSRDDVRKRIRPSYWPGLVVLTLFIFSLIWQVWTRTSAHEHTRTGMTQSALWGGQTHGR